MAATKSKPDPLATARADLAAAEAILATLHAGEREALSSAVSYSRWQSDTAVARSKVARLTALAAALETETAEQTRRAEAEQLAADRADQEKRNQALAQRLRTEGGPAVKLMCSLLREIAVAEIETGRINRKLAEIGEEEIAGPDRLARLRTPRPKEVVSEEEVTLWCYRDGTAIAEQDAVEPSGDGSFGLVDAGSDLAPVRVYPRKFRAVRYHPAEERQTFVPLWTALRLPDLGEVEGYAPRYRAADAIAALDRAGEPIEREAFTELVPVGEWIEQPASRGGGRFARAR